MNIHWINNKEIEKIEGKIKYEKDKIAKYRKEIEELNKKIDMRQIEIDYLERQKKNITG